MSENFHCHHQKQHQRLPSTPERKPIKIPTPRLTKSKNSRLVFPTPEYTPDVKKRLLNSSTQNPKNTAASGQQQHPGQNLLGNQLFTPHFVAKRSFDILSEDVVRDNVTDNDEDKVIFIRPKRSKLTKIDSDEEGERLHEHDGDDIEKTFIDDDNYDDNDSEASTEVASQIDGEFYKTSTRSEIEHQQNSFKQVMDGCMTPERTKSKHELILDNTDTDDDQETLDAEIKRIFTPSETKVVSLKLLLAQLQPPTQLEQPFTTPEFKIIENAPQVRRYKSDSFDDYASQQYHEPLENFNANEELLLINSHGDRRVKKIGQLQEPYRRSGNLLGRLTKQTVRENDGGETDSEETDDEQEEETGEENEDALEQRLIQEALRSDNKGLYKEGLHGNYSDDEGYSEAEEFVFAGPNNSNNGDDDESGQDFQFMSNYFKRMREKRRLASAFREKSSNNNKGKNAASQINTLFSYSGIPASPIEPEELNYNSSEEEEEAYLQKLLNKHKGILPHPAITATSAVATGTSTAVSNKARNALTIAKKDISTSEKISATPAPTPAQLNKHLRMQRKKLMQVEEDKHDNYLNFGFTLGELSSLRKCKKILVFEDPKGSDNSGSDRE